MLHPCLDLGSFLYFNGDDAQCAAEVLLGLWKAAALPGYWQNSETSRARGRTSGTGRGEQASGNWREASSSTKRAGAARSPLAALPLAGTWQWAEGRRRGASGGRSGGSGGELQSSGAARSLGSAAAGGQLWSWSLPKQPLALATARSVSRRLSPAQEVGGFQSPFWESWVEVGLQNRATSWASHCKQAKRTAVFLPLEHQLLQLGKYPLGLILASLHSLAMDRQATRPLNAASGAWHLTHLQGLNPLRLLSPERARMGTGAQHS